MPSAHSPEITRPPASYPENSQYPARMDVIMGVDTSQARAPSTTQNEQGSLLSEGSGPVDESRDALRDGLKEVQCRAMKQQRAIRHLHLVLNSEQRQRKQENLELEHAKAKIRQLETELNGCRAQIFNSIPIDGISDSRISDELKSFQESLSNWVEALPEIIAFQENVQLMETINGIDLGMRGWPTMVPEDPGIAQVEVITKLIFACLFQELFQKIIPGAPLPDCQLLCNLQDGMELLEPMKDHGAINSWRSDTIRSYTSSGSHQATMTTGCSELKNAVYALVLSFQYEQQRNWDHKLNQFATQTVDPAARLALEMARSPQQYHWEWYKHSEWYLHGIVTKQDLERFIVLDIQKHTKVQPAKFTSFPADRKIGDLLFVMYPALFRRGKEGYPDIHIEKAVIVIRVIQAEPTIKQEQSESSSTVGFMKAALNMAKSHVV